MVWKMRADVAEPCRAKQRIAQRVRQNVTVRMTHWTFIKGQLQPTNNQLAAALKSVQVIADTAARAHGIVLIRGMLIVRVFIVGSARVPDKTSPGPCPPAW